MIITVILIPPFKMQTQASSSKNENFQRQGSMRKIIPADPNKENLFDRQNEHVENLYKVYRQEYTILAEYKMIQSENIRGVYVIPSRENSLMWFGIIFVRSGYFEGGVFRFTIFLDETFPDASHPRVIFHSEMYHPVVDPQTKELYLLGAFPKWDKSEQHLWQVLKYLQWIFYKIELSLDHAVNMEAAKMFKNDQEAFKSKTQELVKLSNDHLYDDPPTEDKHYICFEPYVTDVHDRVRATMISTQEEQISKMGLSWVLPGNHKSLTRPPTPPSEDES
ncbi:ubiquitin E2 variant domain-containing protein pendolino [Leptinotarsa decemlineata]|uniref:ubiquitin E2 variant domain-containing protein pendolino n=1 Tax=Leptinotarsa decemlineata TaxID=7539 RepID=UPI003D306824